MILRAIAPTFQLELSKCERERESELRDTFRSLRIEIFRRKDIFFRFFAMILCSTVTHNRLFRNSLFFRFPFTFSAGKRERNCIFVRENSFCTIFQNTLCTNKEKNYGFFWKSIKKT